MFSQIKNKVKKGCLSVAILSILALAPTGANAFVQSDETTVAVETVATLPANNPTQAAEAPESEEQHVPLALQEPEGFKSDYGESKIAHKMTQAEKNQNAKENDGWGGAITIIAMCIVVSALVVLSVLFMIFGKISEYILTRKKKEAKAAAAHEPHDDHGLAPGEVIAAISLALSEYFGDKHDIEDTHLTIRRLQKSYSPWNSKIYNLRPTLEHKRNQLPSLRSK